MGETEKKLVTTFGSALFDPLGAALSNIGSVVLGSKQPNVTDVYSAEELAKMGIIPGGMMIQPGTANKELSAISTVPALSTGGIVYEDNPEGVGELDSWEWTQALLEWRREVAAVELPKIQSEQQARTMALEAPQQTSNELLPILLVGAILLLVIL